MLASELIKLLKPIKPDTKLIAFAENPDGLTFQDEPDLEIESASYDKERNTIFLDCKTTVSRNTQDI